MANMSKSIIAILLSVVMAACAAGCTTVADTSVDGTLEAKPQQTVTAEAEQTAIATTEADLTTEATAEAAITTIASTEADPTAEAATTTAATATAIEQQPPQTTTAATTAAITTTAPAEQPEEAVEVRYAALTFDDGPNTVTTPAVLDVLEKYGITASFFLVGSNINDDTAEVVKRAYDMGCEINNHSKSHPYMNEMTAEEIIEEFTYTDDLIYEITGERSKFFRPPYIAVSQDMLDNIDVPFVSGIGCNDWDDKVTVERRHAMIMRQVKDGSVILLHDAAGNSKTVEALDLIIPDMLAQGYKFVTMSELFDTYGVEISGDDEKIYSNVHQTTMY